MVSARTTRANRVQSTTTMAAITEGSPAPITAASTIDSSTAGDAIQTSIRRETPWSIHPPKMPAMRPNATPMIRASEAAISATATAVLAAYIRRDSTQRPRLSVPSGNVASPPSIQAGGNCADSRSCSIGSCGASSGASSATKKNRPTNATPSQSRCPPRANPASHRDGRSTGPLTATSTMTQPRVQQRHQQVDREVEGDEEDGEGQDQPLDQRKIAVDHRVDRHVADPLIGEDAFHQHGAAKQQCDLNAAERDRWNERVGKHLAQQ